MRSFTMISAGTLLAAMPLLGTGCVQQDKYDQLVNANRSLQDQNIHLADERDSARADLDTVRNQLAKATGELNTLKDRYNIMDADLQKILSENESMMNRVRGMEFGPLPEDLNRALADLAAQYPDMLTFDAKRGMLRFASDFTFALGSAELNANASNTLTKLAQVLNSSTASNFEVHVVGHTDSVPVSNPRTKQMFPDNMYLSAGRAIAVHHALVRNSVSPNRVMIAGWGEYRPAVTNNAGKSGTAPNRRVEIYLAPMQDSSPAMMAETPGSRKIATPATGDEPMK